MPSTKEEIFKELDDMRRQCFQDWKERVVRVEEPFIKTEGQKEAEAKKVAKECLENFIQMAHDNPEWHLKFMGKELEHEYFCIANKRKYEPSWRGGVPGYWDFRKQHAEEWILKTRERLPNE